MHGKTADGMVYDNCDTFTHGDLFTFRVIAELRSSQLDYLVFSADTGGDTSLLENSQYVVPAPSGTNLHRRDQRPGWTS
ncbi:hypothetical protein HYPSUDRAFT_818434 [Hypholoma sublateritium FD-334 SS-4]|uniref:Uncharacterized protein n=1 Tax=Hypholoma sublateritium (strain FD-334 SS-4) TaxID=945553 RepID=A0A0D2NNJ7_HYPSF|nr:hypothetical protein HYPSUDRAFT_818434 [Hypholoma sublateritium FD-334 SS-4]